MLSITRYSGSRSLAFARHFTYLTFVYSYFIETFEQLSRASFKFHGVVRLRLNIDLFGALVLR